MSDKKCVRVRIAVAVDETGDWSSAGWRSKSEQPKRHDDNLADCAFEGVQGLYTCIHWVEADIPLPETTTHFVEPTAGGEVDG